MKRILSNILAMLLLFSVLPLSAAADDTVCGDFTYTVLADNMAKITGYSGTDAEVEVPGTVDGYTVTELGASVFDSNTVIKSVTLPATLTSIGRFAFSYSSLTEIIIPDSVISMSDRVFEGCTFLTDVTLPSGITGIPSYTFINCSALKSCIVPDGIKTIGNYGFKSSGLCTVTIPKSVTRIAEYTFESTQLTDVYYAGTEEEWNEITIGSNNEFLTQATIHYNYVPKPPVTYLLGDVDGDEEVGVLDATYIQRYNAGFDIPISEDVILLCGDIDGDEEIAVIDATYIQRYSAGFNTPYPIGEPIAA